MNVGPVDADFGDPFGLVVLDIFEALAVVLPMDSCVELLLC